jgi:hypothetical protein
MKLRIHSPIGQGIEVFSLTPTLSHMHAHAEGKKNSPFNVRSFIGPPNGEFLFH